MKILCFGDSNTYGYDPRSFFGEPYPPEHRWPDLLSEKLNCTVINEGENGREIPKREGELARFDRMLSSHHPIDLLIVMLGTNDLLQGNSITGIIEHMAAFLGRIHLEPNRILLIAPPPLKQGAWVQDPALVKVSHDLSNAYRALAQRLGVRFADAGSWGISIAFDGVHFTEEGHSAFAEGLICQFNKGEASCWNKT